jgi:hypothetical protein
MDNSFPQQGSNPEQARGLFGSRQVSVRLPNWLARLFELTQMTEEEQRDAGIHLTQMTEEEETDAGISW